MNALTSSARSTVRRQARLVIIRANGPLFYSVAIASFLEAVAAEGVPASAAQTSITSSADVSLRPQMRSRAAFLRDYVQQCWPEFDWANAFEHYHALLSSQGLEAPYRATPAREALARCTNSAQAAVFYRAMGRWSDDHTLRAFAREAAVQSADAFVRFQQAFQRTAARERLGAMKSWRTLRACVRQARDVRVKLAFDAITAYCGPNPAFPTTNYLEFLQRMRSVIVRCAVPAWRERLLFKEWGRAPVATPVAKSESVAMRFKPVFASAA